MIIEWNSGARQQLRQGGFDVFNWSGTVTQVSTPAIDRGARRRPPQELPERDIWKEREEEDRAARGDRAPPAPVAEPPAELPQPPIPRLDQAIRARIPAVQPGPTAAPIIDPAEDEDDIVINAILMME